MNSYPENFLTHPQPLMFVAGLTTGGSSSRDRSASVVSQSGRSSRRPSGSTSRRPSDARRPLDPNNPSATASGAGSGSGSTSFLDPSQSSSLNSLTTPLTSPSLGQRHAELPRSPPPLVSPPGSQGNVVVVTPEKQKDSAEQDQMDRDFEKLVTDLRGALEAKSGKSKVWLPEAERKDFRIMLVDKSIRLPARKATPQTASTGATDQAPQALHSPLSPLTPSSPTYPDGLIAPIWVRKHAELIPSVFVLFLRMWECPNPDSLSPEELRQREREKDDSLVKEIADRRRRLGERGIKLTVVLMASAAALDSPILDPRLSYLRRASSLSAKASLFVLTPVPADQLPDFVQSLQDALFDSAMEYYAAHGKKVRRKRVRLPSAASGAMTAIPGKTLGSQGWAVRYDFKGAWFAELRGDLVDARRHYEDCWNELAKMFSSTQTLPPRTKRWAEAKVLADCVAFRICRLLLYSDDVSKVLTPFHVHLKRFGDLSRGWGIGEDAFEYWSSLARQYRIFAELLEMAQADNVQIPTLPLPILPAPGSIPSWQTSHNQPPPLEYYTTPVSSLNPLQVLQQPAYYYYAAAVCTLERRKRFEDARAVQEDAQESEAGGHIALAPGYANETKVHHAALAIELFTKAYSFLKDQPSGNKRVALYVAFRIAETYCTSSQHDLAMRFFDRISDTFKEDKWSPIVRQIRTLWYQCAQHTGNVEAAAKLLLEMMSPNSGVEAEERASLQDDFLSLLKTTQPSSTDPIVVFMDDESALLDVRFAFWQNQADLGGKVPFQLSMACDSTTTISQLQFSSLHVSFTDDRPDLLVNAGPDEETSSESFLDVGLVGGEDQNAKTAALTWQPGSRIVLSGQVQSEQEIEVKVETVRLAMVHNGWTFQLLLPARAQTSWYTPKGAIAPVNDLSTFVEFVERPFDITLDTTVGDLCFVGEQIPVSIKIVNTDERRVYLRLSMFLPPGEEEQDLTATYEGQETSTLLQDLNLGPLEPSAEMAKTILVKAVYPGSKLIDFSLQASLTDLDGVDSEREEISKVQEFNHTATLEVVDPFEISSGVTFRHISAAVGEDGVEGWVTVMSVITLPEAGSRSVGVQTIKIEPKNESVQLLSSSLDHQGPDTFPQDWTSSTPFSVISKFALRPSRRPSTAIPGQATDVPAQLAITWQSQPESEACTTYLPLPTLSLPPQDSFITAHLRSPSSCTIGHPTLLSMSISNAHPSATATTLAVSIDPSEHFMWVGPRSVHVAPLRPGETGKVDLQVVATGTGAGGRANLPRVRLWEGVDDDREELDVVVLSERGEVVERAGASVQVLP